MKIWNITAALAVLTLATACDNRVKPDEQIVKWEVSDGQTIAVISKRPGIQIAYITESALLPPIGSQTQIDLTGVGRIQVGSGLAGNDKSLRLNKFPFVYKIPGQSPVQIACPNCLPCLAGDDCVPPTPPKLTSVIWPAAERLSCAGASAQFNDANVCAANCGTACSFTPDLP